MCECSLLGIVGAHLASNGRREGGFSVPRSLCIDKDGALFMADIGNQRIKVVILKSTWLQQQTDRYKRSD